MATRGSDKWRRESWGKPCDVKLVTIPIYAGGPKVSVNVLIRDATIQLGAVFLKHNYIIRRAGCYNCRQITGGTSFSAHAWGLPVDVNDDTNPYRRDKLVTDMPRSMIQDVYRIRTRDGVQVYRWGGDWDGRPETPNSNYDAMHFEPIATPTELARGFSADPGEVTKPITWPVIRRGAVGTAVLELQRLIGLKATTGAGTFGPRTETAVILYQQSRGMVADGIVGHATWTALLTNQPPLVVGKIGPQKEFADVSSGSSSTAA